MGGGAVRERVGEGGGEVGGGKVVCCEVGGAVGGGFEGEEGGEVEGDGGRKAGCCEGSGSGGCLSVLREKCGLRGNGRELTLLLRGDLG